MTNKINSIDVSECSHHYTNPVNGTTYHGCAIYEQVNELGYSQDTLCEQNPDCYFKQLKRLQEENEELTERIESYNCNANCYKYKEANKYKQALEELKEENKNYAKLMLEQQEISQKYWECIEKIKQAIEVLAETCNVYPLKTNLDKLITTINEVLNDRN